MKAFYVIRSGWNAANKSSTGRRRNPRNQFESGRYMLVGITEAESAVEAVVAVNCSRYNNQSVWAVSNPRSVKGLTEAIRNFQGYALSEL